MRSDTTNAERSQWAKDALCVFTARTFSGDHPNTMDRDDLECAIADLICDLMHYARRQGFDTGLILQQACRNYESELLEEGIQP